MLNFGIIGIGNIAHRVAKGILCSPKANLYAVASRNKENAKEFKEQYGAEKAYGSYEELLNDSEVDAVYIASPHETHFSYIKESLQKGKHVLCEKPMVLKEEEATYLFELAAEKQLILMEAIKTAYCPGFNQLLSVVRSGVIGTVTDVESCFTKLENPLKRELTDTVYGGSFIELASYTLLPIIKILGENYKEVRFESIKAANGLDIYTKAYFNYNDGFATSKNGLGVKSEGQLIISGTRGYILVEAPWWKTTTFEVRYEDSSQNEHYFYKFLGEGLRYEVGDFVSLINGFRQKSFKLTRQESVRMAGLMEEFLKYRNSGR